MNDPIQTINKAKAVSKLYQANKLIREAGELTAIDTQSAAFLCECIADDISGAPGTFTTLDAIDKALEK